MHDKDVKKILRGINGRRYDEFGGRVVFKRWNAWRIEQCSTCTETEILVK